MSETMTRRGKIAGLPLAVREELNTRLLNGEQGPTLLPWLNSHPDALRILSERWGADPISAENLSQWRNGGFAEWVAKRERVERTKHLAQFCRELGDAGAGELGLPAALAGGVMMDVLENFDGPALTLLLAEKPEKFVDVVTAMAKLQSSQTAAKGAEQKERGIAQKTRELDQRERGIALKEQEFQRKTCELFVKWSADQAALAIANGKGKASVKVDQLMLRMFGEKPKTLEGGVR